MTARRFRIAVVVVARNAESTIAEALESIVTQDFDDFHIVFFDDCSTDSTAVIASRFRGRVPFVVGNAPTHCGRAKALGYALEMCLGEYVIICDADDRMRPGALRALAAEADRVRADMVVAPIVRISGRRKEILRPKRNIGSLNDMPINTVHFSLCNKLLRLDRLRDDCVPFPGIERWEDIGVVARFMASRPKISAIDMPVYDYIRRQGAITLSTSDKSLILRDRLAMVRTLDRWFQERGLAEEYAQFISHLKFYAAINLARRPGRDLKRWSLTFPETHREMMSLRHVPFRYRLICKFVLLFRDICSLKW